MRRHEERQKIYQEKYEKERQIRGGGCIFDSGYLYADGLYGVFYSVCP